ncbi:MAG: DUF971 domain-containing protein [Candidatus Omnitrophica bacterium]|nr:DUF971 domain-containing protein [Candidatus Omnitrophota bacterium]
MTDTKTPVPIEIGRANEHDVKIRWQDGHESVYPARALRLACPCAGCAPPPPAGQAAISAVKPAETGPVVRAGGGGVAETVHPVRIDLVGRYAISIQWSDGHNTGIYTFERLRTMCPCCSAGGVRQGARVETD